MTALTPIRTIDTSGGQDERIDEAELAAAVRQAFSGPPQA